MSEVNITIATNRESTQSLTLVGDSFVVICGGNARELKRTVRKRADGTEEHVLTIIGVRSQNENVLN